MTVKSIEEQISTIREATQRAAASPQAALEFLRRAGIVSVTKRISKSTMAKTGGYKIVASGRVLQAKIQAQASKNPGVFSQAVAAKTQKGKSK